MLNAKPVFVTMYQLVDKTSGDNVCGPFYNYPAAQFWIEYNYNNCYIVEIEVEYIKEF